MKSWLSHTLCIPRNETQRTCSIFVNIDCVFSRLYCALIFLCLYIFFGCWYNMEVKTICYVVQYAVHMELCSTNLFFFSFWISFLFIGTFFNKILLKVSSWLMLVWLVTQHHSRLSRKTVLFPSLLMKSVHLLLEKLKNKNKFKNGPLLCTHFFEPKVWFKGFCTEKISQWWINQVSEASQAFEAIHALWQRLCQSYPSCCLVTNLVGAVRLPILFNNCCLNYTHTHTIICCMAAEKAHLYSKEDE